MSEAALDRLSLTLPDWRGALKRRVRRPKLPNKKRLVCMAIYGTGFVLEAGIFVLSLYVPALMMAVAFAIELSIHVRRRHDPLSARFHKDRPWQLTSIALWLVAVAWSIPVLAS